MKRVDFSIKEGRADYHAECEQHFTAKQKYNLILAVLAFVAAILLTLLLQGWAVGGGILMLIAVGMYFAFREI